MKKKSLQALNRLTVEEFKQTEKVPIVLLLDNVRSALNVGSAFRTADAFALEQVVLCGITATPPHREILKTAIGATQSVDWQHFENTMEAVNYYLKNGYTVLSIEQTEGSTPLSDFKVDLNQKYVVILGNEVKGVAQEVVDASDYCIEIPQFGTKHSLNVSVCAGVVIWDLFKQMSGKLKAES